MPHTVTRTGSVLGHDADSRQFLLRRDEACDVLIAQPEAVSRDKRLVHGLSDRAREAQRLREVRVGPQVFHGVGEAELQAGELGVSFGVQHGLDHEAHHEVIHAAAAEHAEERSSVEAGLCCCGKALCRSRRDGLANEVIDELQAKT